jgi:putative RecB family exonuclease
MSQPDFDVRAVFLEELDQAVKDEARKTGFEPDEWFWSGRMSGPEAIEWWKERGPEYVQNFIDWWEHNPEAEVWITPDGTPAIELPFEVSFGDTEVRGFIDLVLQIGTALVVVDWKSSAKAPDTSRQLAIYACALELKYGIRPRYGTHFMVRGTGPRNGPKTFFQRPVELSGPQYSVAYLAQEFAMAEAGIRAGAFPANPGERCGRCGVAYACTETAGPRASELDPNYPAKGAGHG